MRAGDIGHHERAAGRYDRDQFLLRVVLIWIEAIGQSQVEIVRLRGRQRDHAAHRALPIDRQEQQLLVRAQF